MSETIEDVPGLRVGDFPEPAGDQPMSPAELRMVRDYLGLTGEWLAGQLGVQLRTIRRWEHGQSPVPEGVREQMELLEGIAAEIVGGLVERLEDAADMVLTIPDGPADGYPAGWWRMVAARVAQEVPGLYVRYDGAR
ncbi:MAG TPA: hypothetical protein VFJ09_02600 [Nocardioidaceae bacterium]|nr:hypothetical protein [Nocardioidaceae bacterium]